METFLADAGNEGNCYQVLKLCNKGLYSVTINLVEKKTRLRSSGVHAARFSCRLRGGSTEGGLPRDFCLGGVCPGGVSPWRMGVCPGSVQVWGASAKGMYLPTHCMLGYTPVWTEWLTERCKNITLPQT